MNPLDEIKYYPLVVQKLYENFINDDQHATFTTFNTILSEDQEYYNFHKAFDFFLESKYNLEAKIKEKIYGTNRVFYYIYKDSTNNDLRIINHDYGCFHYFKTYLSLEDIDEKIKNYEKEIAKHQECYDNIPSYYQYPLATLHQVQEVYHSLKKSLVM